MACLENRIALVFGASGISGWAVTNNLLFYPTTSTFSRVIALTHRSMNSIDSHLPTSDPRLEIYSGINLREDLDTVKDWMRATVPNLEDVTHIYYCAYSNATAYSQDVMDLRNINVTMTSNAIHAADELCKSLKFVVLQTGTNNYGVAVFRFQDKIDLDLPLKENQPRIPPPWGNEIFYYAQVDIIKDIQQGKPWQWCEVRPDAIVGFTPGTTNMSFLEPTALFLALWRYVNGFEAEVPFIGTELNYRHRNTDTSQDVLARTEIYLSVVKPNESNGRAFNCADSEIPASWVERWPIIANFFGLKGTPPNEPADKTFPADEWWIAHKDDYRRMCAQYGLKERVIPPESWIFALVAGFSLLNRDRYVSLSEVRSIGFMEEHSIGAAYSMALERMVQAKILPSKETMNKRP